MLETFLFWYYTNNSILCADNWMCVIKAIKIKQDVLQMVAFQNYFSQKIHISHIFMS